MHRRIHRLPLAVLAALFAFSVQLVASPLEKSEDSRPAAFAQLQNSLEHFFNANTQFNQDPTKSPQGLEDTAPGVIGAFFDSSFLDSRFTNHENEIYLKTKMFSTLRREISIRRSELSPEAIQILIDELQKKNAEMEALPNYRKNHFIWPSLFTGGLVWAGGESLYRIVKGGFKFLARPTRPILPVEENIILTRDSWLKRTCKKNLQRIAYRSPIVGGLSIASYYSLFRSKEIYVPIEEVTKVDLKKFLLEFKDSLPQQTH